MIYAEGRYCFIHIPRTAGTSIESVVARHKTAGFLIATNRCGPVHRHQTAAELSALLPDWDKLWKWCVVRDPWSTVDSIMRFLRFVRVQTFAWNDELIERSDLSPGEFALEQLGTCNFYSQLFASTGDVEPFRLDELEQEWPRINSRCELPQGLSLPRLNRIEGQVEWTQRDIEIVGDLSIADCQRFGWQMPDFIKDRF